MIKDGRIIELEDNITTKCNVFGFLVSRPVCLGLFILCGFMMGVTGAAIVGVAALAFNKYAINSNSSNTSTSSTTSSSHNNRWTRPSSSNIKGMNDLPKPIAPRGG